MVLRETNAQIAAALVGILLLFALPVTFDIPVGSTMNAAVLASFYAVVFGGAHLYLALVGESDADFPVTARWRTVLLVAGLATLAIASHGMMALADLSNQVIISVATGIGILVVLGYWYLEARDGYRDARPGDQGTT
ncbi:hypothetical protein [Halapricum hydrolyticum]|uniref:Uncharacterized protein n=1 Tax=Halapricum hydrolyticum TaxID=2979991 RepID=A0AAE3IGH7_9EURY|nr:hypothetical protein [Halapricum hydrolyticum]MCU4719331.1 hypothetical protein [Halapricum hydrolyticum]MCU4728224.1 hypothetical protein [Halapricum hydrolyticum]